MAQADTNSIQIAVRKPGYDEQQLLFAVGEIPASVEIRLKRSGAGFFGRVIDDAGKPVRNFSVRLNRVDGGSNETYWRWFDDEEGRFSLIEVPPGTYSAVVTSANDLGITKTLSPLEIKSGFFYGEVLIQIAKKTDYKYWP